MRGFLLRGGLYLVTTLACACGHSDPGGNEGTGGQSTTGGQGTTGGQDATGGQHVGGQAGQGSGEAFILPWAVGNKWVYDVTDTDGATTQKTTEVLDEEPVGGAGPHAADVAFHVLTSKADGTDETESWQALVDGKVLRYRELSYSASTGALALEEHWDPYKLHVDGTAEHLVEGAIWTEEYAETKTLPSGAVSLAARTDIWHVDGVDVPVEVAGVSLSAIVLMKRNTTTQETKIYHYVPGVGKVREAGGQTEVLVSYEVSR